MNGIKSKYGMTGKTHSIESRKKIGLAGKGRTPWNKGKKGVYSESTLNEMRNKKLGKKLTVEHRKKIGRPGKDASNYRGGVTRVNILIRKSVKYIEWRNSIYKRDDFTCTICKKRGVELNADHIKPFATIIRENKICSYEESKKCVELWDMANGRTLCVPCHKKTETFANNNN